MRQTAIHPSPFAVLLTVAALAAPATAAPQSGPDPNDPGLLDPVIQHYRQAPWRLPASHQVSPDSELINIVGRARRMAATSTDSAMGHPIGSAKPPSEDLETALEEIEDAAANGSVSGMQTWAGEVRDILLGETAGRIYDGFAMLDVPRGGFRADHVPGEYRAKRLEDRGRRAPGLDGRMRTVWEADVHLLYYDQEMDADTAFLIVPRAASPRDTVHLNYRIYAASSEDFAPTTLINDVSPFGEGRLESKSFDATWARVSADHVYELRIDHGALAVLRGVQPWGWREDRGLYLQPVFERDDPVHGGVRYDPRGEVMMARQRDRTLADVAPEAPERKMLALADAVLAGATPADVLAMLQNPAVAPLGTLDEWVRGMQRKDELPAEVWPLLQAEGIVPGGPIAPYHGILVFANDEVYGLTRDDEGHDPVTGRPVRIDGDLQGEELLLKVINLDHHRHYVQARDYGPALHHDIKDCNYAPSGSHSLEIFSDKPAFGAPKFAELQWRAGWSLRRFLGVLPQYDVFPRALDRGGLSAFTDGLGGTRAGWQYPAALRGGDFRVIPAPDWRAPGAAGPPQEADGSNGLVIGARTPGYGVARMPLGDLAPHHPFGALNADTDGDGVNDALIFPDWMRNPDPAGGDVIPTTPEWEPFLYLSPENGTPWVDPADPGQGWWVDRTYAFGRPLDARSVENLRIVRPRTLGQTLWFCDGLFRDDAVFTVRTSDFD